MFLGGVGIIYVLTPGLVLLLGFGVLLGVLLVCVCFRVPGWMRGLGGFGGFGVGLGALWGLVGFAS